jgi:hypothetical protein
MIRYIKYLAISLLTIAFISGCAATQNYFATKGYLKKENGIAKEALVSNNIKIKLKNEFNEVYELDEVIIKFGTHEFNPLELKAIGEETISSDKVFNTKYEKYSKNGLEKSFLGEYMTFTDEALLGMLASTYSMKIYVSDTNANKLIKIDYKKSNIILTDKMRHNIYNALIDTSKYYEDRAKDE